MKIKKKHEGKITMIIMVFFMTMIISLVNTLRNYGLEPDFAAKWLQSWGFAFIVALPVVMIVMPNTKKLVSKFVEKQ
ncbi:MAG: hypothetical protein AUK44_05050 [Porphyromonadaceae bacterium CG2_30_38_12]|nr:MAG: hypothetical protein AUK44_05050 [Porphyromonadaceae bacterium CG2_30_38_12]